MPQLPGRMNRCLPNPDKESMIDQSKDTITPAWCTSEFYWGYLRECGWGVSHRSRKSSKTAESPKAHPSTGHITAQIFSPRQCSWSGSLAGLTAYIRPYCLCKQEEARLPGEFQGLPGVFWVVPSLSLEESSFRTSWILISFSSC